MPYQTITGHTARAYAEAFDASDALTSDGTITLDIDCDLDGDQLAVIATHFGTRHELVAMPASYDASEVTEADLHHDGRIYAIQYHRPVDIDTVVRYTVEFRRHHLDPWQEAEPGLDRDDRYPATREQAEDAILTLQEQDARDSALTRLRTEYRVATIEFTSADWEDA